MAGSLETLKALLTVAQRLGDNDPEVAITNAHASCSLASSAPVAIDVNDSEVARWGACTQPGPSSALLRVTGSAKGRGTAESRQGQMQRMLWACLVALLEFQAALRLRWSGCDSMG